MSVDSLNFFFFQAEDGIRDTSVTGVQTCALPIWQPHVDAVLEPEIPAPLRDQDRCAHLIAHARMPVEQGEEGFRPGGGAGEIGRASCRERVWLSGGEGTLKKTM